MVTAIVTCCRRLHNVERIWRALRGQSHACEEIWLFYNGSAPLDRHALPPFDRVVRSDDSDDHYTRFAVGLAARTEWVFILDDDCVPGERWVENCLETARTRDGIFAPGGYRITRRDFTARKYEREGQVGKIRRPREDRVVEIDVPYHSFFLRRAHLAWTFREPLGVGLRDGRTVAVTGQEDILLAGRAWRHAGVRCWLPRCADATLRGADDEIEDRVHANWMLRKGYHEQRLDVLRYEASLGWKPAIARSRPRWWRKGP